MEQKKTAQRDVLKGLHNKVKMRFINNPTTTKKAAKMLQDSEPVDPQAGYLGVEFKRVNVGVEKLLSKQPIRVPGIGLPKCFHEIFDQKSPEKEAEIKL